MKQYYFKLPLKKNDISKLNVGDLVYLSGSIYTARDQAHKRLCKMIEKGEKLPFNIKNTIIYYTAPSPKKHNEVIGSFGPTTASRMDAYAPILYDLGVNATIGKGDRNNNVINSIVKNNALYFLAIGGTGALLSNKVNKCEIIAFEDLLGEAIYKIEVKNFPCYVAIDSKGETIKKLWK